MPSMTPGPDYPVRRSLRSGGPRPLRFAFTGQRGRMGAKSRMKPATRIGEKALLVVSLATLALAANHFFFHWVAFTGALLHRWFFGV